jgi:putative transposase
MKRARFTEEQIIAVLKEHEAGAKTADLARNHVVSKATLYNRKAKFGGMDVSEAKRLKVLEEENARLKKLLAEQMLDAAALRELLSRNGRANRQAQGCRASAGRDGPVGAAGLPHRRSGPEDSALPILPAAGHGAARSVARAGERAPPVWLPAAVHPAPAGERAFRRQPHPSALSLRADPRSGWLLRESVASCRPRRRARGRG